MHVAIKYIRKLIDYKLMAGPFLNDLIQAIQV
jgi:hypothetical protein